MYEVAEFLIEGGKSEHKGYEGIKNSNQVNEKCLE